MKLSREFILLVGSLVLFGSVGLAQTKPAAPPTKPQIVHQDEFLIAGIEARTSAAKESSGETVIPQQWMKFMQEGVLQRIPNKADEDIYALYTDFANKRSGEYSVVIGAKITDKSKVPADLVVKTVPAGTYAVFQTSKGPAWEVIPAAWQSVADAEDKGELGYVRTYKADYELYHGPAMDPQDMQAELHVGVK